MVEETIQKVLTFFDIKSEILVKDFKFTKDIPSKHSGVYVISEGDHVVYVGKGHIRNRQKKHWEKAHNELRKGTNDTKGWTWLRDNYTVYNLTPTNWTVRYLILKKQTELSAVEGALIHLLQPLANDETFHDNQRNLKG